MLVFPLLFLSSSQILNIKKAIDDEVNRKVAQKLEATGTRIEIKPKSPTNLKSLIFFFLLSSTILSFNHISQAKALYSDSVVVSGITLSTADFTSPNAPTNLHWINPEIQCGGYTNSFTATAIWDNVPKAKHYVYEINYPPLTGGRAVWQNPVTNPWYSGAFNQAEGLPHFSCLRQK